MLICGNFRTCRTHLPALLASSNTRKYNPWQTASFALSYIGVTLIEMELLAYFSPLGVLKWFSLFSLLHFSTLIMCVLTCVGVQGFLPSCRLKKTEKWNISKEYSTGELSLYQGAYSRTWAANSPKHEITATPSHFEKRKLRSSYSPTYLPFIFFLVFYKWSSDAFSLLAHCSRLSAPQKGIAHLLSLILCSISAKRV